MEMFESVLDIAKLAGIVLFLWSVANSLARIADAMARRTGFLSIGIGGSIVVMTSVLFALTFLPAFLGMVGPRVNSWSPGAVFRRFRPVDHEPTAAERGR